MSEDAGRLEPVNLPRPVVLVSRLGWAWALSAIVVGAVSALAAALVRLGFIGLGWVITHSAAAPAIAGAHLSPWRRVLTPFTGGLLATAAVTLRSRRAKRLGREPRPYVEYVEAVRHRGGVVPLVPNCWRTAEAAFSIATGAAVGREGSMIQFAAAIASLVGRWLQRLLERGRGEPGSDPGEPAGSARSSKRLNPLDLRLLVAFGVAGGVTAAYNAPLAAVFFAAEIALGAVAWKELPLLVLAAGAGRLASGPLLGWERLYPTHVPLAGQGWRLLTLPLLATSMGLAGPLYQGLTRGLYAAKKLPLGMAWAGLLVGLLSVVDPRVWGNGDLGLSAALGHADSSGLSIGLSTLAGLLAIRLLATTVCVGTGTVGGVFTPTLFAGAAAGALLGQVVSRFVPGLSFTLWALVAMSGLMAAVTHAPIMAALMAVELTGEWRLLPGLLVLNWIAWRIALWRSPAALYAIASQSPTETPEFSGKASAPGSLEATL